MSLLGGNSAAEVAQFGAARAEIFVSGGELVLRILWPMDGEALLGLVNLLAGRGARMIPGRRWTAVEMAYTERLGERVRGLVDFLAAIREVDPQLQQLEMGRLLEMVEPESVDV